MRRLLLSFGPLPGIVLLLLLFLFFPCATGICKEAKQINAPPKAGIEPAKETDSALECPELSINDSVVRAGLLYDLAARKVAWQKNADKVCPIASLTKMMVVLLVIEDIRAGKLSWDTPIQVTPEATMVGGSSVRLRKGVNMSVQNLLKAAMINSGNDATYLLAQYIGGSEAAFVNRMNRKAAQLGMNDTRYSNSTGMPASRRSDDNCSTPSDLLKLSIEMLKYKEILEISSIGREYIPQGSGRISLRNHNHLVEAFEEVDGFKTGFTLNAKFCVVATSCKNDRRLVSIALGAPSPTTRNRFVADVINTYYEGVGIGPMCRKSDSAYRMYVGDHRTGISRKAVALAGTSFGKSDGASITHRIRKGETLYVISKKYHCSVADLKRWNRLKGSSIKPGQQLKIRTASGMMMASADKADKDVSSGSSVKQAKASSLAAGKKVKSKAAAASVTRKDKSVVYYHVRPGDTLWNIASQYEGVTVKKIMKTNGISQGRNLKPGTKLKIVLNV